LSSQQPWGAHQVGGIEFAREHPNQYDAEFESGLPGACRQTQSRRRARALIREMSAVETAGRTSDRHHGKRSKGELDVIKETIYWSRSGADKRLPPTQAGIEKIPLMTVDAQFSYCDVKII
jgi:hypothetical protein